MSVSLILSIIQQQIQEGEDVYITGYNYLDKRNNHHHVIRYGLPPSIRYISMSDLPLYDLDLSQHTIYCSIKQCFKMALFFPGLLTVLPFCFDSSWSDGAVHANHYLKALEDIQHNYTQGRNTTELPNMYWFKFVLVHCHCVDSVE